jgi:hypothetical protein
MGVLLMTLKIYFILMHDSMYLSKPFNIPHKNKPSLSIWLKKITYEVRDSKME